MTDKKQRGVIEGAFILIAAVLVVKVIGAFFKIPLTRILGGTGMGYFMTSYSLFNPIQALSAAGLPVAVSKLVSESMARGRYRDVKRIFRVSFFLFVVTGILGSAAMFAFSAPFTAAVGNPKALWAVAALSPAVFFGCLTSAYRGYCEGLRNMVPTALSQIVEAVVKLAAGILLASKVMADATAAFLAGELVYGVFATSAEHAAEIALPYAAAGAALGITLSCFAGMVFLIVRQAVFGSGLDQVKIARSPEAESLSETVKSVMRTALPVCVSSVVVNLSGLIDLTTIINRLDAAVAAAPDVVYGMYAKYLPEETSLSGIPNFLYGSYTALAGTVFHIVPSLAAAFGTSALPAVSASHAVGNRRKTTENVMAVLRITAIIVIPAGLGIAALASPILSLLFSSRPAEAAIAGPLLEILGFAVVFAGVTPAVNSMLQAVGRADIPVYIMLAAGVCKFVFNYVFIALPEINITAASYGTVICYIIMAVSGLFMLVRVTGIKLSFGSAFLKPTVAGVICAVGARTSFSLLARMFSGTVSVVLAIGIGMLLYGVSLVLTGGLTRRDLLMLPGGEKIAKRLEKYCDIE